MASRTSSRRHRGRARPAGHLLRGGRGAGRRRDRSSALTEEDFVHPAHRAVFKALRALVEAQVEVNSLTLKDALDQAGDLSRVGGYTGLVELLSAEEVGRPQVLADLLVRKRKLRQLIRLGAQLVRQAAEEEAPPDTLVEQAGRRPVPPGPGPAAPGPGAHRRRGPGHHGGAAGPAGGPRLHRPQGRLQPPGRHHPGLPARQPDHPGRPARHRQDRPGPQLAAARPPSTTRPTRPSSPWRCPRRRCSPACSPPTAPST